MTGASRLAASALGCCLLAACTTPPPVAEGDAVAPVVAASAPATDASRGRLRPLAPGLAVPAGAAPRSLVPAVDYGLASRSDLSPDDGLPGDAGPRAIFERGGASWYGIQFHQRKTANGERFDMGALTAAHKTLPFHTRVCVRSLVSGKEVLVRINDRGPYAQGRIIDLSRAAADQIGLTSLGIKQVALSVIDRKDQRCGGAAANLDEAPIAAAPATTQSNAKAAVRRAPRKAPPPRR